MAFKVKGAASGHVLREQADAAWKKYNDTMDDITSAAEARKSVVSDRITELEAEQQVLARLTAKAL